MLLNLTGQQRPISLHYFLLQLLYFLLLHFKNLGKYRKRLSFFELFSYHLQKCLYGHLLYSLRHSRPIFRVLNISILQLEVPYLREFIEFFLFFSPYQERPSGIV